MGEGETNIDAEEIFDFFSTKKKEVRDDNVVELLKGINDKLDKLIVLQSTGNTK